MKKLPKNKRGKEGQFEKLFIRKTSLTARSGKMIYVRREFHDTILALCQVIGNNEVTMSGYIDNVLAHHFETYGAEITRLYDEKKKGLTLFSKSE